MTTNPRFRNSKISKEFEVLNGFRQDSILSPILLLVICDVCHTALSKGLVGLQRSMTFFLKYRDYGEDICLFFQWILAKFEQSEIRVRQYEYQ